MFHVPGVSRNLRLFPLTTRRHPWPYGGKEIDHDVDRSVGAGVYRARAARRAGHKAHGGVTVTERTLKGVDGVFDYNKFTWVL